MTEELPNVSFENLSPQEFENAMKQSAKTSSLIDATFPSYEDSGISEDHLAFEFIDNLTNAKDFKYKYDEAFPEDNYEKGYKDSFEMSKSFSDIYDYDDPYEIKGLVLKDSHSSPQSSFQGTSQSTTKAVPEVDFHKPIEPPKSLEDVGFNDEFDRRLKKTRL